MHSYIIAGGTKTKRKQTIQTLLDSFHISAYDVTTLEKSEEKLSIGIMEVKACISQSSLSPRTSPFNASLIEDAHLLTIEAQNALLKTLEEPPRTAKFFLETHNPALLVPTILSRCEIITLPKEESLAEDKKKEITTMLSSCPYGKPGAVLSYVDTLVTDKLQATDYMYTILLFLHSDITNPHQDARATTSLHWSGKKYTKALRASIRAYQHLLSHVNFRLVFDEFFLSIT